MPRMDLSDGLMGDLPKILAASNVSAELDLARDSGRRGGCPCTLPEEWLTFATRGGEDYELLFTVPEGSMGCGAARR